MVFDDERKTDFTNEELKEIIDSFLEYKTVLDKDSSVETHYLWGGDAFLSILSQHNLDQCYLMNMKKIIEKYGEHDVYKLSLEKLDFLEITTIMTYIPRVDHHDSYAEFVVQCVDDGTYYNLLCRLEEIRSEL